MKKIYVLCRNKGAAILQKCPPKTKWINTLFKKDPAPYDLNAGPVRL